MVKKMKKWSGIQTRVRITTKNQSLLERHPLPMSAKFGRRPFPHSSVILFTQVAQLLQSDRATLCVVEYFANSLKVIQGQSKWHIWVGRV